MTACVTEAIANDSRTARHSTFTIAADGSYAARLNSSGDGWYPERWTLDGPEPYAVPLPGSRPEQADSQVLPLADGRVLIARRDAERHQFALLYPTGPGTGELSLGAVESERLTLLPPAPCGRRAYALAHGERSTGVWLVSGSGDGYPQHVAEVPGRCSGGAWLDHEGRLLAVDRTDTGGTGRTKTVVVDLARRGEVSPLLQITEDSDDRLLLADADSGLLIVRSDAPGESRLGWGVLGSHRPVRFPESLHPKDALLTPFAVQPGQMLLPESCAVAMHGQTTGARAGGAWLGVWRPMQKELRRFRAPAGWLPGRGVWTREGELRLPCATAHAPCGLARLRMRGRGPGGEARATAAGSDADSDSDSGTGTGADAGSGAGTGVTADAGTDAGIGTEAFAEGATGPGAGATPVTPAALSAVAAMAAMARTNGPGAPAVQVAHGEGEPAHGREPLGTDSVAEPASAESSASPGAPAAPAAPSGSPSHGAGFAVVARPVGAPPSLEAALSGLPGSRPVQRRPLQRPQRPPAAGRTGEQARAQAADGAADTAGPGGTASVVPGAGADGPGTGAPRKPVPLQDAPLPTGLHEQVVHPRPA